MSEFGEFAVLGLPIGCVYALMAMGLVLTYKTSGVFHLAYAGQAFAAARIYYELRVQNEWPIVPAAVLVILVISPPIGLVLERLLFRHTSDQTASLIVSLGLLVALPQITIVILGDEPTPTPPGLWPDGPQHIYDLGITNLDGNQ